MLVLFYLDTICVLSRLDLVLDVSLIILNPVNIYCHVGTGRPRLKH